MNIFAQVLMWWAVGGFVVGLLLHFAHRLGSRGDWNDKETYEE